MGQLLRLGRHHRIVSAGQYIVLWKAAAGDSGTVERGTVVSLADRKIIFVFPVVCIVIRYLVRPFLYAKTQMFYYYGEILAEYLTNYLCFVLLSIQIFTILFLHDIVESILSVLILDTAVLIGLLITGLLKDSRPKKT